MRWMPDERGLLHQVYAGARRSARRQASVLHVFQAYPQEIPMTAKLTEAEIAASMPSLGGWSSREGSSLQRSFVFEDAVTAMGFVVRVAMRAEVMGHHPELHILYGKVDILLTTHDAGGVTGLDLALARQIDACV
jgi:4a-hydroxytetrahydrobiopterin dehydratase